MKNLTELAINQEVLGRLKKLSPNSNRLWGKMSVTQMLGHCAAQIKLANGEVKGKALMPSFMQFIAKQSFGFVIPWPKNLPTAPEMVISNPEEFQIEMETLIANMETFRLQPIDAKLEAHPIFGKMRKEEWGKIIYKHLDHHLKQFGA